MMIPAPEELTFAETSSPQESASESESELEEFELLLEPDFEPSESFFELNLVESRFWRGALEAGILYSTFKNVGPAQKFVPKIWIFEGFFRLG